MKKFLVFGMAVVILLGFTASAVQAESAMDRIERRYFFILFSIGFRFRSRTIRGGYWPNRLAEARQDKATRNPMRDTVPIRLQ